jgi:hypothetical protein
MILKVKRSNPTAPYSFANHIAYYYYLMPKIPASLSLLDLETLTISLLDIMATGDSPFLNFLM